MRWNDVYINAAAASLGRVETTDSAVADGRYEAEQNTADGYLAVRVADDVPTIEMAVTAAELALERSGKAADEFELLVHSSVGHQGLDHFAPASYVQSRTIGGRGIALEVKQASNGGLAALEVAAAYLTTRPAARSVLITTSDRFGPPSYDRYHTDGGLLFSDGATALVLSHGSGVVRLLSTVLIGDTAHHGLYNENAPWSEAPGGNGWPVNLTTRQERHVADLGGPDSFLEIVQSLDRRQQETVELALADAELEVSDIDWWVFPNVGQTLVDWDTYKMMGVDESRTTTEWGRRIGHLGAGDQFAGLAYLLESRTVRAGDRVLLNGAGQGFTFGSAVVEIIEEPAWSNSAD
jgi:3-oxoacyl-[acyl-carrier-protein] synthase-3